MTLSPLLMFTVQRYRVLGVSELARQLEEKKEQIEVMKQKISRLEITLVRVENRASSLEKKLKSSSVSSDANKTTHIPGPSKQILDTLLAENNTLKTALNNLTNRGHSGYVTAVVRILTCYNISDNGCLEN